MEVYNTLGQQVKGLGDGFMNEGVHTLKWNGTDEKNELMSNGIYLVKLITDNGEFLTERVVLNR
ncbi:MAG: flagellar hook assembly protein FlgD [Crocinitomicaceae bacterium]|jgi:flagellar hook assembly protein FlgD